MTENSLKQIKVRFAFGVELEVPAGTALLELCSDYGRFYNSDIIAARVDNDIRELGYRLENDCRVSFIDLNDEDGMRIYRRSLYFILIKAVHDLFPERKVIIHHAISKGLYCEINGEQELKEDEVSQIEAHMRQLTEQKLPFKKKVISAEEARNIFMSSGREDRYHAIEHRLKTHVTLYSCDGLDDYFYGYMAPDTGYIKVYALKYYKPGLVILFPDKCRPYELPEFVEHNKLFSIFHEYKRWGEILGVANVGALNDIIKEGKVCDLIRVSEALQEKKIAQIADKIYDSRKRIVLISGPSSSGKTTFAHRLSIQLRVNGLKPVTISLDDYFVNREMTPKDEDGDYNYEALEAIDIKLFNSHLKALLAGGEVEIPEFNFSKGCREAKGKKLKIDEDSILVIEGIHGLNERLTSEVSKECKYKVYVSALTSMNIDDHNRIPTTDTRIIRRIVRDYQFRGSSAAGTIRRWPSVRRGEEKNIFPFQESADVMFNSSFIFELGILKTYAEPLLAEIESTSAEYSEARRLIEFLSYFLPIDAREIPLNSIIREFVGGSCFY